MPDPAGLLDLPEGFSYRILDREGETMSDGYRVPGLPDGMGCFSRADGKLVLMRNHELGVNSGRGPYFAGQAPAAEAYNRDADGGVTRLVLDEQTLTRESSNLVLVGTVRNCSGGVSPWGWLTCEETFSATHGYTFLCSPDADRVAPFQKIPSYGHFYHEGAAVDPRTNIGYFTEDLWDGCLFRFLPDTVDEPFVGRLQALGIAGKPAFSTKTGMRLHEPLEVIWVDLPEPDPLEDLLRSTATLAGAATVSRGEGMWYADGVVYFTATTGGMEHVGQVFALRPTKTGGSLELIAESTGSAAFDMPDAVALAPWGDVLITEDPVSSNLSRVRGITPEGQLYDIARTNWGELSGLCFSPDGRAMFLSIFNKGITMVVTGPFATIRPHGCPDGAAGAGNMGGNDSGGAPSVGGRDAGGEGGESVAGGAGLGESGEDSGGAGGADGAVAGADAEPTEFVVALPAASCSTSGAPGGIVSEGSATLIAVGVAAVLRSVTREDEDEDSDASE